MAQVVPLALLLILVFHQVSPAQLQPKAVPIHICDLGSKLQQHDGKVIAVIGESYSGPHGATIAAEICSKSTPFKEFGAGFAIDLDTNLTPGFKVIGPNGRAYAVDRDAIREFQRIRDSSPATATFVGVLHVKRGFKLSTTPNQGYEGNGYGHMGRYPAELALITVHDVVLVRK